MASARFKQPDLERLWGAFNARMLALGELRGREIKTFGSQERSIVEVDGRPYMVFVPNSQIEITRSRIVQRTESWKSLRGRTPAGYVILAPFAELAPALYKTGEFKAGRRTAVVGRWGTENQLAASSIDDEMALLLDAAGVPESAVVRALQRSQATQLVLSPAAQGSAMQGVPAANQLLRPGHLIDAYRLEKRLGSGHSAEVWRAAVVAPVAGVDLPLGGKVALKLYVTALLRGFESLRIQREFAVAAALRHPNLARVFDLVLSPSRPHHAFLAMEFIDGPTLKQLIEAQGRLAPRLVLRLAEQLFGALEEIHTQGALHRDVKAANILVAAHAEDDISVKLVDLGIVSIPAEDRLTQASVFLGSKHSAPMEQLRGQSLDERTDIYGAGSVLFHAITGRSMYANAGPEGAIVVEMLERPERLSQQQATSPLEAALADFTNKCIAVKSSDRPATAADCLALLRRVRPRMA